MGFGFGDAFKIASVPFDPLNMTGVRDDQVLERGARLLPEPDEATGGY
jgi:hypothetical protein